MTYDKPGQAGAVSDPADAALAREQKFTSNGLLLATLALLALFVAMVTVFVLSLFWTPYCSPGAPCDTALVLLNLV